jgi:hypothetical protein
VIRQGTSKEMVSLTLDHIEDAKRSVKNILIVNSLDAKGMAGLEDILGLLSLCGAIVEGEAQRKWGGQGLVEALDAK